MHIIYTNRWSGNWPKAPCEDLAQPHGARRPRWGSLQIITVGSLLLLPAGQASSQTLKRLDSQWCMPTFACLQMWASSLLNYAILSAEFLWCSVVWAQLLDFGLQVVTKNSCPRLTANSKTKLKPSTQDKNLDTSTLSIFPPWRHWLFSATGPPVWPISGQAVGIMRNAYSRPNIGKADRVHLAWKLIWWYNCGLYVEFQGLFWVQHKCVLWSLRMFVWVLEMVVRAHMSELENIPWESSKGCFSSIWT